MKNKITLLLSIVFTFSQVILLGNNTPVLVTTIKDNLTVEVSMNLEIKGSINLYSMLKEEIGEDAQMLATANDKHVINWVLHPDKDFYIGIGEEAEAITPSNFRRLARRYFADAPELMERIGKRGFRYKNLPSMILYYNKMIAKENGLTKADVLANASY